LTKTFKISSSESNNFEALLQVILINIRHIEVLKQKDELGEAVIEKFMKDNIRQEFIESTKFEDVEELIGIFEEINSKFIYIEKAQILNWLYGEQNICVPAVYWVIRSLEKVAYMISLSLNLLEAEDISKNRKIFIIMTHRLSRLFDLLYAAALSDENDIFYVRDPLSEDLGNLLEWLDFSMPEDIQQHKENTLKGIEDFHKSISIAQRGFKNKTLLGQLASSAAWAMYYKVKKEKIWDHGSFLMSVLDKEAVVRILKLIQSNYVEKKIGFDKSLPKIALHQLILVPFNQEDILTLENLDCTNPPKMVTTDLDLPFEKHVEKYDKTTHVQIRILSDFDWERVDWENYRLIDPNSDCVHLEAIIIHVHGGGFIAGSSASSQINTRQWSSKTKCPVFSVDYRLSPDYKFPDAVNDCWQFYWWMIKYAKKYLKITFEKVVLIGDSAGGNLILAVTTLAIQKKCKIPDGLNLIYPAIALSRTTFAPSALLWLDDVYLSATFLSIWSEFYTTDEFAMKKHMILSPSTISDEIISRYPVWRFTLAGHDPLRDDAMKFMLRLKKQKVDVRGVEFKALMHAFLSHNQKPFSLPEAQKAWDQILEYLEEIIAI
jgi:acetyl esterase/lipase